MITIAVAPELTSLRAGVVAAEGLSTVARSQRLEEGLEALLARRLEALTDEEDSRRRSARDLLRHGRYKPTGRGKPASEYLLRSANEGRFPRINALVDVCNYISLKHVFPISLWDIDRCGGEDVLLRRGHSGESYVFNSAGQEIALEDLLLGSLLPSDRPIINPVKDSMATKTTEDSTRVAAVVYAPVGSLGDLSVICTEFAAELAACGESVSTDWAVLGPGEKATLLS